MMGSRDVCVGIDIGTSSVKAVAVDPDGEVVSRVRIPHRLHVPAADRMEHDPTQAWRRGPRRALAGLHLDRSPRALSVAAMVPSFTAVDGRGRPLGPGLLYGDDRGRTGSGGGEAAGFLRWLAGEHPGAAAYWPAQAVANHALGGVGAIDGGTAFSTFPLFGLSGWDVDVLKAAGVDAQQLPLVVGNGEPIGVVGDAVLGASSVDAMAEQLVAGATGPGDVLVICGTTLIVWANVDHDRAVEGLMSIPSLSPGRPAVLGGASNAGGLFLDWASRLFARGHRPARPDHVPVLLPYVRGERTPYDDSTLRASVHGLGLTHDAAAARRGAFEASGFAARHLLDLTGVTGRRIVATGGGTRSPEWMQALADATGLPVDVAAVPEGAALGAAWFARMAAGLEASADDAQRWARTSHRVEPHPDWVGPVADRYQAYRALAP
ncbi:MAG: xylB [Actinomycetia bacterium]|nr:xylB [Actinomycetes bacterium]